MVAEKHGAIKIIGKSHRGKLYSVPGGPEGDPWLRPVQRVVAAGEAPALANGAAPGPSSVFALAAHLAAPPVATALKQSPRRSTPPRLSPRNQKGGAGPTSSPSAATTSTPNDPQTWKAASKTRKKPGCASSTQTTKAPAQRPEHTPVVLVPTTPANAVQHGGTHYKQLPIEPWDYIVANGLGFLEGNAIKYLTRWRSKGGIEDLKKAAHYVHKLIEVATHTPPRTV